MTILRPFRKARCTFECRLYEELLGVYLVEDVMMRNDECRLLRSEHELHAQRRRTWEDDDE